MRLLGSDDIPPEIWLHIASYMQMVDIRRAEALNRTFAALVAESQKVQRSRLILNTSYAAPVLDYQATLGDWTAIARNVLEKLQECICINRAPHIKHVVFYSYPVPARARDRGTFNTFKIWLKGNASQPLVTHHLRSAYGKFQQVESLSFVHSRNGTFLGPQSVSYMAPRALWTIWGPNLRELSISTDDGRGNAIPLILSSGRVRLPRLEVMRFASSHSSWGIGSNNGLDIKTVADLYTSAAATLHTLEIHLKYIDSYKPVLEDLLPQGVVFEKLRHLSFELKDDNKSGLAFIPRFVHEQSHTLRSIQLHDGRDIFNSLIASTPSALLKHEQDAPPVALAIQVARGSESRILDRAVNGGSLQSLRRSVVALRLDSLNSIPDYRFLSLLGNLRVLSFAGFSAMDLRRCVNVAHHAPQIVSLSIYHHTLDNYARNQVQREILLEETTRVLKQWTLKDIGLYGWSGGSPTWWYMEYMTTLIPSIESFCGQGHKEHSFGQQWEQTWAWRRNMYLDRALRR